jgi:hypothetical protein
MGATCNHGEGALEPFGTAERSHPFGPALNLAQQAGSNGVRHMAIRARAA